MMSKDTENYSKARRENNTRRLSASKPRKVLIFGLGLNGGGVGSARFFSRQGVKVTITDLKSEKTLSASLAELSSLPNIKYVLGKHRWADFKTSDLIVKNPAIPWDNHLLKKAQAQGISITTDTILFFSQVPALTVGITGTKGKSTTATLLAKLCKKKYSRVWLAGNIGESFLDKLPEIKSQDVVIAELSSFQLEDLALIKKSPPVAIITNIFPDHLNRYSSFKKYAGAKTNIFRYQKSADHLIINGRDKILVKLVEKARSQKHFLKKAKLSPLETNLALAALTAKILGVSEKEIAKVIKNFRGLAGRQEIIREFQNRIFINDTTATNPTAVLIALQSLAPKYRRPIILIAGGQDKNLDYKKMAQEINKKVKQLILLPGNATEKIKKYLHSGFLEVKNMEEAVKKAHDLSQTGDLILLSPGAASFNLFQNEFDRGAQFNQRVKKLY